MGFGVFPEAKYLIIEMLGPCKLGLRFQRPPGACGRHKKKPVVQELWSVRQDIRQAESHHRHARGNWPRARRPNRSPLRPQLAL